MKCPTTKSTNTNFESAKQFTYSDGAVATLCKNVRRRSKKIVKVRNRPPPVNRNEPMTKVALKRTLNRYFERLFELDINNNNCLFVTLTISSQNDNKYQRVSGLFKRFIGGIRGLAKNSYIGTFRSIELQRNGFFHIHCVLIFDKENNVLSSSDIESLWKWGLIEVKAVKDRFGLFDYFTNIKHDLENGKDEIFTKYPKGARIIYISPNLPKCSTNNSAVPQELSNDCEAHIKSHQFYDSNSNKMRTKIDKLVLIEKNSRR